jgi:hypothetical protein
VSLLLLGLFRRAMTLVSLAADPAGQFGIDFGAYRAASLELLKGSNPYPPEMLAGPFAAQGIDNYVYPPLFAQLLTPIAVLPSGVSADVWLLIQASALFAACWLAGSAAGAPPTAGRVLWTSIALLYFFPVFDTLWKGNVEGPIALAIGALLAVPTARHGATGGREFVVGAWAALTAVVKLIAAALLPAAVSRSRRLVAGIGLGSVLFLVPSVLAAPRAWIDYASVLSNLANGYVGYPTNFAPSIVAFNLGAPAAAVAMLRIGALVLAGTLVLASVMLARRESRWPAAVACATTAALLLPAALWYHYFTMLIPLAIFAWFRTGPIGRANLFMAAGLVTVGLVWLPLVTVGAAWLAATIIAVTLRDRYPVRSPG